MSIAANVPVVSSQAPSERHVVRRSFAGSNLHSRAGTRSISPYVGHHCLIQNSKSFNRLNPIFSGTHPIKPEKTVKPTTLAKTQI